MGLTEGERDGAFGSSSPTGRGGGKKKRGTGAGRPAESRGAIGVIRGNVPSFVFTHTLIHNQYKK